MFRLSFILFLTTFANALETKVVNLPNSLTAPLLTNKKKVLKNTSKLYILRTTDVIDSLNRNSFWLERYLDVDKTVITNLDKLPKNASHKVFLLNTLLNSCPREKLKKYPNSVLGVHSVFESTSIPQVWVDDLNQNFDFVSVSDPFLVDVYKNSGVEIPIFFLPEGSLLEDWLNLVPPKEHSGPFLFLASGALFQPRKNHDLLIEAFQLAFGNREDVQLKIHARGPTHSLYADQAAELITRYDLCNCKNIIFHYGTLDDKEYKKLFLSCNCLVNIASGEGFSITPREALAVGIPAILTDNSAQTTICNSGFVRAVPCSKEIDGFYNEFGCVGHQYNPTVEEVAKALLDVYNNYLYYKELAEKAKPWVEQYTAAHLIPKWKNLLAPSHVILGERNEVTNEYLMTNSPTLYEKLCALK